MIMDSRKLKTLALAALIGMTAVSGLSACAQNGTYKPSCSGKGGCKHGGKCSGK